MLYARSIYSRAFYPPKLNQRGVLSSACHATQRREWPATVRRRRRSSRERICLSAFTTTTTTFSSVRFAANLPPTASHSFIHLLEFRCYSFFLITFTPSSPPTTHSPFRASRDCRDVQDWCRTFRRIYVRHNSPYLAYILLFLSHLGTRTECTYLHSCSTCPTGFLLRVQHTLRPHRSLPLEYPPLSSQRRYP